MNQIFNNIETKEYFSFRFDRVFPSTHRRIAFATNVYSQLYIRLHTSDAAPTMRQF